MTDTLTLPDTDKDLPPPADVIEWLREQSSRIEESSSTGPCMVSIRDDVPANGKLYLCTHSGGYAMTFAGAPEFINRWLTWALNWGVINPTQEITWFGEKDAGRVAYICPHTQGHILRGLISQFSWEIKRDREIPLRKDYFDPETEEPVIEHDERAITDLATARAEAFMRDHIQINSTILGRPKQIAPIYGYTGAGRAESSWGRGSED